ncbi:MAG: S9 family peptidase [Bacteroidetes bacterium]|nr:S9 family peptidase [Bacteroidota bacterium]
MKRALFILLLALVAFSCSNVKKGWPEIQAPVAEKIATPLVLHGDTRIDFYYWMNDRNNPKVIEYLNAENEYVEKMMEGSKSLRDELYKEMEGRIKQEDESAPYFKNGYFYYTRYEHGGEYPIYCRKKGNLEANEEIILNVPVMAKGYSFFSVGDYDISPDNSKIAFTIDTLGRRQYTIKIKDLESAQIKPTGISQVGGDVVWAADNSTVFFNSIDPVTLRYDRIKRYNTLKDDAPVVVYYENDETYYYMGVSRTKDDHYIKIESQATLSNEILILKADNPQGEFKVFSPREKEFAYEIEHLNGMFYVLTSYKALNYRLMETTAAKTDRKFWQEVIPHREDVFLEGMEVFENYLVLQERNNALRGLRIIDFIMKQDYYLDFNEEAYSVALNVNADISASVLRYYYTSLTTPGTIFDYDMLKRQTNMVKQTEVLGGFEAGNYETKRVFVTVRDGEKVPLTMVYKKGINLDGNNPALLYGYGSYGSSVEPRFNSNWISLLDRGFVVAMAHVRGGQEMGRKWYEAGRLLNKKNSFYDFIDLAKYLIDEKYTNSNKLFAQGGSAGGLLIGAVANMAPELFKGIIAAVPFVDVVTTMMDETIPLTTAEYTEWGNPEIKEFYDYMLSYSPYDNITKQNYPNILITSGLHDSQVQYFEPSKWIAKLREYNTANTKLLLTTNMDAGHGGASGRFRRLNEIALQYAFMLELLD